MTSDNNFAAFISGSTRGIGFATALELARHGFNIAINGIDNNGQLDQAVRAVVDLGVEVVAVPGDIAKIENHTAMLDCAEKAIGPLTTLINNAGVSVFNRGDLLEVTPESYDRCQSVNCRGHFFLSQTFARRLLERGTDDGQFYSLINVTSSNAVAASTNRGEYCISKAAAAMSSKLFAVRLGNQFIAVYDVQPGVIETDMTKAASSDYQQRIDEQDLTLIPRLGQPQDMARIIATLATGGLPYTTGQVISADAGMLVSRF